MDDRAVEVLLEQASVRRRLGDWRGAIDLTRRALALDPDHARAHAALAFALLGARRLPGAGIEARASLALDGNDAFCHHAAAAVLTAERKLREAWEHCLVVLDAEPHDVEIRVLGATIHDLRGERAAARELLRAALEHEPTHCAALTRLARLELRDGNHAEAARLIDEALRSSPADTDAHIAAGTIALVRGDLGEAEHHARFALGQDATDRDAFELWCSIKARRSWTLGLWWRFNAWVSLRSETQQIALMIGTFVVARLAIILAGALDLEALERALDLAWMGFCAYTWVGPAVFRRMIANELGTVRLDPNF